MEGTRLSLCHPCFTIGLIVIHLAVVPISCISNYVNNDKDDHNNNVDHWDLPPTLLETCQHTSLARITCIAKLLLIIAPPCAIWVGSHQSWSWDPHCLILIDIATICWGLAATRLWHKREHYFSINCMTNGFSNKVLSSILFGTQKERVKYFFITYFILFLVSVWFYKFNKFSSRLLKVFLLDQVDYSFISFFF